MGATDYEVRIIKSFNITELKPFQCTIKISIQDKEFEKRLINVTNEKFYGLNIHLYEDLLIRLFTKNKFHMKVEVAKVYKRTLDMFFEGNPNIDGPYFYDFNSKAKLDAFAEKASTAILSWLNEQFKIYKELQQ